MSDTKTRGPEIIIAKPKVVFTVNAYADPTAKVEERALPTHQGPYDPVTVEAHKTKYKLSVICAHCERWYMGIDRHIQLGTGEPRCASSRCGGLTIRRGYPEYKGPLEAEFLISHCVTCGEEAAQSVTTPDGFRRGYCKKHLDDAIHRLQAKGALE